MAGVQQTGTVVVGGDGAGDKFGVVHLGVDEDDRHTLFPRLFQRRRHAHIIHRVHDEQLNALIEHILDLLILPLLVLPRVAHQEQIAVALDLHLDLIVDGLIKRVTQGRIRRPDHPRMSRQTHRVAKPSLHPDAH